MQKPNGPTHTHYHPEVDVYYDYNALPSVASKSYAQFLRENALIFALTMAMSDEFKQQMYKIEEINTRKAIDKSFNPGFSSEDYDEAFLVFWQMMFSRCVDNAICYLQDVAAEVFSREPERMDRVSKEGHAKKYAAASREEKIKFLDEAVQKLKIQNADEFEKQFKLAFSVSPFADVDEIKGYRSYLQIRNFIVHNRGVADMKFRRYQELRKNHVGAPTTLGARYITPSPMEAQFNLSGVVGLLDLVICNKFGVGFQVNGPANA